MQPSGEKFGKINPPQPLPGIKRVNTVKILGVSLSDDLSVEDYVYAVISSAAQTLHALQVWRSHDLDDAALQMVYRAVIVSMLQPSGEKFGFKCVVGILNCGR